MAEPPTIGSLKSQGVKGVDVYCVHCRHRAALTFEQLRVPDEMLIPDIMKYRKLTCSECGSKRFNVTPDWPPTGPGGMRLV